MTENTAVAKQHTRQKCKRTRSRIPGADRRQASQMICMHIQAWGEFQRLDRILTYLPMRSEVDLMSLMDTYPGRDWAIPRILPAGKMQFHRYDPHKLVLHPFGMLEPDPACPLVTPREIQLVLVPGLAYDRDGWRLGYGGGFYDRFLESFQGISVGVNFHALILPQIPHQDHDIPMQFVVTEQGILNTGKRG